MSKKSQMVLVLVVSAVVWVGGVAYFYRSYNSQEEIIQTGPGVPGTLRAKVILGKEVRYDPRTGKWVEKGFVEAEAPGLFLLTLLCGGAALVVILRAVKRRGKQLEQETEFATLALGSSKPGPRKDVSSDSE